MMNTPQRKFIIFLCTLWLVILCSDLYAQPRDLQAALQYVNWARQAIDENRIQEALAALERAADFADVSSDVSYLLAVTRVKFLFETETRLSVLEALNKAIETNRWVIYSENQALLLKAEQLIAMREYEYSLICLDKIEGVSEIAAADVTILRLLALRGMAAKGNVFALAQFRSLVLTAFDRFPRDPRPLRIFFEYARNRQPEQSDLPSGDFNLMGLALRRLPFLLEIDPELAWMAAPFIRNTDDARRLVASYRAGGIPPVQNSDFIPHSASIPAALNLGLIDDIQAVNELFSASRGLNSCLPSGISAAAAASNGNPVLDKNTVIDVYNLLRSEEGREYFTTEILSFSGIIFSDDDNDGNIDTLAYYNSGVITQFALDKNQNGIPVLTINFSGGVPVQSLYILQGQPYTAIIDWERYPSVKRVELLNEIFLFRPADFMFAPVTFIEIGGSGNMRGLLYPVHVFNNMNITRHTLVSFCSQLSRPGVEKDGSVETFFMENGIPLKAIQTLDELRISLTEFERGLPVIQYLDFDLDGRMETIRRFRNPTNDLTHGNLQYDVFNYRSLIASSESDWSGDGRNITKEVYLPDGSVVYYFNMDGEN